MTVIPQRDLRNEVSDVLRRAEAGETFTITVNGRPVAQLGPIAQDKRTTFAQVFQDTPVDSGWLTELKRQRQEETA
ncbi:MAG: type II toxin-antitoxin system prevent-host-death family antitoxin [Actinomycetota bacterium]|nr:type II toxin-antitoxin system prevent-host-death family antitoxin [Actinomycetota bacterium]